MLQRGLKGSNPLMGLSFWRNGIIAADAADGAVSLVGSERPPMECCSRPLRARDRWLFDCLCGALAAAERQSVGPLKPMSNEKKSSLGEINTFSKHTPLLYFAPKRPENSVEANMLSQASILIRVPRAGDGDGLARSWIDAGSYYAQLDPDLFQVPAVDGLAAALETWVLNTTAEVTLVRVAEHNRAVVGFIHATIQPPLPTAAHQFVRDVALTRVMIDALIVQQAYWRHGIGTQLLMAAEAWGRSQKAVIALLDTYSESPISIPFYEQRMGYRRRAVHLRKSLR
jgi:GNAT superfamily N-acetyltransferase